MAAPAQISRFHLLISPPLPSKKPYISFSHFSTSFTSLSFPSFSLSRSKTQTQRSYRHLVHASIKKLSESESVPIAKESADLDASIPTGAGVYGVFDANGELQFIGISSNIASSVDKHRKSVPSELCSSVKVGPTDIATPDRMVLQSAWKSWIEEHISATGKPPPGNVEGNYTWTGASPDLRLTLGHHVSLTVPLEEELDKMNEDKLDSDEEELNKFIGKNYTRKEIEQLFLLGEIETKAEMEEKEKNLASAYDEDANPNSKKPIKEESTESEESEKSTEYEESQKSTEYEESKKSEESTESEESQKSKEDIPYMDKIDSYQRKTGLTDAIQTGIGQLDGIPVALAVMDFEFIGGSMGSVVGEKITRLIQYATRKSLPLIISCASGGARMQEGSFSLMQMAKISSTLLNFQFHENLFFVSLLTSPTTGGITASFGMLGDIIIGEPDATIAFAGKRVIEEVMKIEVPEGVQEAEYLFQKGSLDLIVPRNLLKGVLSELLAFHGILHSSKNKGGLS